MRKRAWPPLIALMLASLLILTSAGAARAEDGYDLWLRYRPVEAASADSYRAVATGLMAAGDTPTIRVVTDELERGLSGLTDRPVREVERLAAGTILYGTPAPSECPGP